MDFPLGCLTDSLNSGKGNAQLLGAVSGASSAAIGGENGNGDIRFRLAPEGRVESAGGWKCRNDGLEVLE